MYGGLNSLTGDTDACWFPDKNPPGIFCQLKEYVKIFIFPDFCNFLHNNYVISNYSTL